MLASGLVASAAADPDAGPVDVSVSYTWNGILQTPVRYADAFTYQPAIVPATPTPTPTPSFTPTPTASATDHADPTNETVQPVDPQRDEQDGQREGQEDDLQAQGEDAETTLAATGVGSASELTVFAALATLLVGAAFVAGVRARDSRAKREL